VSVQGRNTQGVRLIRLKEGEKLVGLEQVDEPEEVDDLEIAVDDQAASIVSSESSADSDTNEPE